MTEEIGKVPFQDFQGGVEQQETTPGTERLSPTNQAVRLVELAKSGFSYLITQENFPAIPEHSLVEWRYSSRLYHVIGISALAETVKDPNLKERMEEEARRIREEAEKNLREHFEKIDEKPLEPGTNVPKHGQYL